MMGGLFVRECSSSGPYCSKVQVPVVQRLESTNQGINYYPVNQCSVSNAIELSRQWIVISFSSIHPLKNWVQLFRSL